MKGIKISSQMSLFLIFFYSCQSNERAVIPAFYHWKTNLNMTRQDNDNLQKIGVKKLYAKFFDIDWSPELNSPNPVAPIQLKNDFLKNYQLIPTVFITNRTFLKASENEIDNLVKNVVKKLKNDFKKFNLTEVTEIQFDCDWSEKTRTRFFDFLKKFKTHYGHKIELSATIRLHQIKFFEKTGVPPVERGMLMFYNMSDVSDWTTRNSIIDLEEAKKYLANFEKYPMKLDVVLPVYSWGVLFRDTRMIKLIPGTYLPDYQSFTKISHNRFKLQKSGYFEGHYLYKNDRIRLEDCASDDLLNAAEILSPLLKSSNLTVGFYHLHERSFKRYSHEDYLEILEKF